MADTWSKLDIGLMEIFANYQFLQENGWDDAGWLHPVLEEEGTHIVPVVLRFTGGVAGLAAAGLVLLGTPENDEYIEATVDLDQLDVIAANPQIIELAYGFDPTLNLDKSIVEIEARKSGGSPRFVWDVNIATGAFSGFTGDDVIIGFIDTGIDFNHPVFLDTANTTRILRIWDQGLAPAGAEKSPDVSLLKGSQTYGVEYKDVMINDVLQKKAGALPVRHKDCVGHGTHVASIAAGDGRAPEFLSATGFDYVGVAPKAKIIMVKHIALQKTPSETARKTLFKDAVTYILRTAKSFSPAKAVVINCSIGSDLGPHDGRDDNEVFIAEVFNNTAGQACVFSAGNAAGKRVHATITIPAAIAPATNGVIEMPFELVDNRTVTTNKKSCVTKTNTGSRLVDIWYDAITTGQVSLSLKTPLVPFTAPLLLNGTSLKDTAKTFVMIHRPETSATSTLFTPAVTRNRCIIMANPTANKGTRHNAGKYILKIEGPPGTVLQAWCQQADGQNFMVLSPEINPVAVPGVNVTDRNTIGALNSSANVITVAAYNDANGSIAPFSSQGPLLKYAGAAAIVADKPDLAAPGIDIEAARSIDHDFPTPLLQSLLGFKYINKSGTSMSSPHVAGVVALMLQKNKNLTSANILTKIKQFKRAATPVDSFGQGKVDAKDDVDHA